MLDLMDGVLGELSQHSTEIERRVKSIEFSRADQAVQSCGPLSAGIRSHEEIVLTSQHDSAQGAFRCAVINFQQPIIDVAIQSTPVGKRIADGGGRLTLGGQGAQRLLHPVPETVQQWPGTRLAYRAAMLGW